MTPEDRAARKALLSLARWARRCWRERRAARNAYFNGHAAEAVTWDEVCAWCEFTREAERRARRIK